VKVFVTGGSGGIGRSLTARLLASGHGVTVLSRDAARARARLDPRAHVVAGDPTIPGPWQDEVPAQDGVVHLAAESIWERRWSPRQKALILESRVQGTRNVALAVARSGGKTALVSASGVGFYYADGVGDGIGDEAAPPGESFIGHVCAEWERACAPAAAAGSRVALARIGVVLSTALALMARPFRLFLGGTPASGRQWVAWIHRDDLLDLLVFALENEALSGPFNAVAPEPVPMHELTAALGRALGRPVWVPVPALLLRLFLGQVACMAVLGARATPGKALALGFRWRHPELEEAFRASLDG
jgi:uncharacterized protein (TIGR01777 family)